MSFFNKTAHGICDLVSTQEAKASDVIADVLTRAQSVNDKTNAIVRFFDDISEQSLYPAPMGIKDNMCIKGKPVTCASKILKGFVSPYDAGVIEKVKAAGIPIVGNVSMDEFAFGSSNETSCYGPVHNPWNLDCVPGGSSGGAAASVAAGQVVWALGSDTGGSVRQPAAFCGVVGLKPTYGRVSRYGLVAFGSSLDQIGPITKDVEDSARLLNVIAGFDNRDSTSVDAPVPDYTQSLSRDIKGLTIGIPKEYFLDGIQPEVLKAVKEVIEVLKGQGAVVKEISLPHTKYAVATYYILGTAEASSNLARFDGVEYGLRLSPDKSRKSSIVDMYETTRQKGFGDEVKRRIMLGTYVLSSGYYDAYYLKAQKVRTLVKNDFDKAFKEVDVIVCPTSPSTAFKIGEKVNDPLSMYLSDIFTIPANLAGIPGMSLPCGFDQKGLPIGVQMMSKAFGEQTLFKVAHCYEQATSWHKERAKI